MTKPAPARVLIVDDEAAQVFALSCTLTAAGYVTTGAGSVAEALEALRAGSFDLLLTDLSMPGLTGIDLLHAARDIDPNLGLIIMTGHGTVDTAVAAMKTGAQDYILKPFKLSDITKVLARALAVRTLRLENVSLLKRLTERTEELQASNTALQTANSELDAFTYSVFHELRNPLNSVIGFAEFLGDGKAGSLNATQQEYLGDIQTGARRMQQIAEDLLRFAHLAHEPLAKETVDMTELVREVICELRAIEPDRRIEIQLDDLPDAAADRPLLKHVLLNLLSNAFKFTRTTQSPRIEIRGEIRAGQSVYCVCDNGAGFDMKDSARLFSLFQRLHRFEEFEGTGAGLSIVKRIVDRHGGQVAANATPGAGAQFTFTLPS
jgi:two-component system sensor histidine kinase/response regulator